MTQEDLEKYVIETGQALARIDERLGHIQGALDRDFLALHGNGHPGILERLTKLEEASKSTWHIVRTIGTLILSLASMAIALYAAIRGGH